MQPQEISNRQIVIDTLKSVALLAGASAALLVLAEATLRFFPPLPPKTHNLVITIALVLAPLLARWLRRAP